MKHENLPVSALLTQEVQLTSSEFQSLQELIEGTLGISMPQSKRAMLETRILRRIRELGITSVGDYCAYLETPAGKHSERSNFLDLATTNKTSFFREPSQFEQVTNQVLPDLLKRMEAARTPLRVWSAACSTGQEVWTLAMLLDDTRARCRTGGSFVVLGSDVSRRVLQTAMEAKYDASELAGVPRDYVQRYFTRSKDRSSSLTRVAPELRRHVGFFSQNLMDGSYALDERVHVIYLRNALIYFSRERQLQIIRRAAEYLVEGGFFVVSLTETLNQTGLDFRHLGSSVYQLEAAP
ncbi:MAG TPA: protein-glutamate O-methyltransferase CheR [Polyangiales bacterium]|nr:protein-glutamate O-methyltransferase CheR [Polyangiales bacterium]